MAMQATKKPHAEGMLWKDLLHLCQKLSALCYWHLPSSRILTLPKTVQKWKTRMKTKQNAEPRHRQISITPGKKLNSLCLLPGLPLNVLLEAANDTRFLQLV